MDLKTLKFIALNNRFFIDFFQEALGPVDEEYFYLYRISYAWYSFIGFCMTVVVGLLVSAIYRRVVNLFNQVPTK